MITPSTGAAPSVAGKSSTKEIKQIAEELVGEWKRRIRLRFQIAGGPLCRQFENVMCRSGEVVAGDSGFFQVVP